MFLEGPLPQAEEDGRPSVRRLQWPPVRLQVGHGELSQSLSTLDRMLATDGMLPRLRSCAPLLAALCDADWREEALRLWEELRDRGLVFGEGE